MEYRYLGNSGLRVSTISLGSMSFGATTNETTARKILNMAQGQGVNFIDMTDAYVAAHRKPFWASWSRRTVTTGSSRPRLANRTALRNGNADCPKRG